MLLLFPCISNYLMKCRLIYILICVIVLSIWQIFICSIANIPSLSIKLIKQSSTKRAFTLPRRFSGWQPLTSNERLNKISNQLIDCPRWSVVVASFLPSEAILRQSRLRGWCMVVVAETSDFDWVENADQWNRRVEVLTRERQMELKLEFLHETQWKYFSPKNLGYLYAVMQGAQYIWEFDNYNEIIFYGLGIETLSDAPSLASVMEELNSQELSVTVPVYNKNSSSSLVMNPYPVLGGGNVWPRGFPRAHSLDPNTFRFSLEHEIIPTHTVAVLQSLAHYQPDLDERIKFSPHFFSRQTNNYTPFMVPESTFTPYNSQATLHMYSSFWALLLPTSVPIRISDIWRGYFAQRLFRDFNLKLGFLSRPMVVRKTFINTNETESDYSINIKTQSLIEFLNSWKSDAESLPERMEELWICLYEFGYIEISDVTQLQLWLKTLIDVGYDFPRMNFSHNHVAYTNRMNSIEATVAYVQTSHDTGTKVVQNNEKNNITRVQL